MDRISVLTLCWNWQEKYLWLLPNEIPPYLCRTFTSMPSGIVEVQNRILGGHSPKSSSALWHVQINNCMLFFQFSLIFLTMPRSTPMGISHEVLALAPWGHTAKCYFCPRGSDSCYCHPHPPTHAGTFVSGKPTGWVRGGGGERWSDDPTGSLTSARALTTQMSNLYGHKVGTEVAEPDYGPLAACHLSVCLSVRPDVCPSVCPSVRPSIHPLNDQWDSLPDHTGFLLLGPACNASKQCFIFHHQFRIVVFAWMCVSRSGGKCAWWFCSCSEWHLSERSRVTTGLPIRPIPAACRTITASQILLNASLITVFRVVPTLVGHEEGSQ